MFRNVGNHAINDKESHLRRFLKQYRSKKCKSSYCWYFVTTVPINLSRDDDDDRGGDDDDDIVSSWLMQTQTQIIRAHTLSLQERTLCSSADCLITDWTDEAVDL
jgi:hypothetical protein